MSNVTKTFSSDALVKKADELMTVCEVELASRFYERALRADPTNASIMDSFAVARLTLGDEKGAKMLLETSVQIAPEVAFEKYFHLGQLSRGTDAVKYTLLGLKMVEKFAEVAKREGRQYDLDNLLRVSASAYCSLVEIYMTDLCDEKDAESRCEAYVLSALQMDGDRGIEALQSLASLRLVQTRVDDAKNAMKKVLNRLDIAAAAKSTPSAPPPFSFEVRVQTVQLLLETNMSPDRALALVHELLYENDDVANVWYLGGLAAKAAGEYAHGLELLTRATQMIGKARASTNDATTQEGMDAQLEAIKNLMDMLRKQVPADAADGEGDANMEEA